jgi:hypothetical protein
MPYSWYYHSAPKMWPPWPNIASFMEEAAMEGEAIFRLSFETATRKPE